MTVAGLKILRLWGNSASYACPNKLTRFAKRVCGQENLAQAPLDAHVMPLGD